MRRLALLAVAALFLLGAAAAQAAVPPCPPAPATITDSAVLTDTDRIVRELRAARIEAAATCDAIRQAGAETRDAADATRAAIDAAAADARTAAANARTDAEAIKDAVLGNTRTNAPGTGTETDPSIVKLATAAPLPTEAVDAYDSMAELMWLLAGLLVAALVAPFLRSMLTP